jgi:tetratricopeptide (TPR) repeat protein
MPASYATLEALLVGPDKACNSARDLDRTLTELEDRGLIGWDREANRYDAHPIVRGVVWKLTDAKDQRAVYAALEAHFEPMATPEYDNVESLADLTPAIERYHTLVGLGRYDDAFALFRDRLNEATSLRLAAHRERIAWLQRLFPDGAAEPLALRSDADRASALNQLPKSYLVSGQPSHAVHLLRRADEIDARLQDDNSRQIGLSNLGLTLRDTGTLREAGGVLRRALVLSRKLGDGFGEAIRLRELGRLLTTQGDHILGYVALERCRLIFIKQSALQSKGLTVAYLAERLLWLGDLTGAGALADKAGELAASWRVEQDCIRAALLQGQVASGLGNLSRADDHLHHALTRARTVNMVQLELPILIAIAKLALRRGRPAEARVWLHDVWEAAEHGPYSLRQADAYNAMAAIARAEGDKPAAIAAATKAYRAAWCDGPPYAYHWGLVKAKARLAALGAPEPDMPPFDESKFEPMPEVEINPKDEYWVDPDKLE